MVFVVTIRKNLLPDMVKQLDLRSRRNVEQTASDVRDRASQTAPRDTGSLADGMYVSSPAGSDYTSRAGTARAENPEAVITQEVTPDSVISLFGGSGGYSAVVAPSVAHGIFNELGTRFMSPKPFLLPATEANSEPFIAAMSTIADV